MFKITIEPLSLQTFSKDEKRKTAKKFFEHNHVRLAVVFSGGLKSFKWMIKYGIWKNYNKNSAEVSS